ncbi:hypothetical protein L435_05906 [Enterobacter hormaechei]|nr:hypothetical protein L435_05906 [Enterobacter hormaechei]CAE7609956.1 hypothetical protein AI2760V1_2418 [Enterobacter cloacae]CAF2203364.1 hypothetical protein AI2747V1_2423 [Enterobacter cloacae]CAH3984549.1 hypothetical protein AI2760V1_2418 [Enterobacter cloacae]CAH5083089.1 hypothetical protein AI2747V1_2423 [Enterobacter cloacae]
MSVNTETASAQGQTTVLEKEGVYASLFEKINLTPASSLGDINAFLDDAALSDAPAGERLTAAMQVFMDCIRKSGQPVATALVAVYVVMLLRRSFCKMGIAASPLCQNR